MPLAGGAALLANDTSVADPAAARARLLGLLAALCVVRLLVCLLGMAVV